ncbi:hypothetical protein J53TS2_18700 [Paenibacillus sp. J53TS2]|nr:hypothetical protein J53TS2_18700 [Paenibacillus sp. J53TS2]
MPVAGTCARASACAGMRARECVCGSTARECGAGVRVREYGAGVRYRSTARKFYPGCGAPNGP